MFVIQAANLTQSSIPDKFEVKHNREGKEFVVTIGNEKAYLKYRVDGDVMDLYTTVVPPLLQRRGIAKALVTAAFDYVRDNNMRMKLTCSYLQYFIQTPKNWIELVRN